MKKLLLWMLIVVLSISMVATFSLTGCKKEVVEDEATEEEAEVVEAEAVEEEAVEEEPEEVTLLLWDLDEAESAIGEWTRNRQQLFSEKYPYIKIDRQVIPPQEAVGATTPDRVALTMAMAAGTAPDAYGGGHFPTMGVWIDQGFAYPLDEYIENWSDFQEFIPAVLTSGQKDGKTYGIPWFAYVMCFGYRKDLYQEAGLDPNTPPKTWEEMAEFAVKLTDRDKPQYGFGTVGRDVTDWWFQYYVWQAGGDLSTLNADKTVSISINSPAVKTALQFYWDLRWKHDVLQSDITKDFGTIANDFAIGECAQIIYTGEWYDWFKSLGLEDEDWGMAVAPAGPSGKSTTSNGGAYWFINPTSSKEKRDAAWEYIKFFTSKEAMIDKYEFLESQGVRSPIAGTYETVLVSDYIKIPEQWARVAVDSMADSRAEYVLVDQLRPYINKAIETVLTDKNADIEKLLDDAQNAAQKEVIDPYNAEVNKTK